MEDIQDQARFLVNSGDGVTINLIPAFSAYLLGVAAFAAVSSQVLGGSDFLSSRSTSDKTTSDNQIAAQYPPPDVEQQVQQYYQPQPVQYYQPTAEQQQQQPEYYQQQQQQQPEYYQQQQLQQQYAQNFNSAAEKQDYVNSQEQVDIYQKLVNLQEELRKLQEAEKLLSNALSRRYTNVAL